MEQISRRAIQEELAQFVRPNTAHGVFLFALDMGTYIAAVAGVLFLPDLWMKILCSVLAGTKISNLSTLAHDAAHGSLTRSASVNRLIAILSFMPGLLSYRLWLYDPPPASPSKDQRSPSGFVHALLAGGVPGVAEMAAAGRASVPISDPARARYLLHRRAVVAGEVLSAVQHAQAHSRVGLAPFRFPERLSGVVFGAAGLCAGLFGHRHGYGPDAGIRGAVLRVG